ncbi:hypothetical protein ACFL34_04660 [Candidatus Sumerlaeota bacterium]
MAKEPWYRTASWTEEDEKRLPGRLKRYKSAYGRAQTLRIKALSLEQSDDDALLPVIERLLRMVIDDPQVQEDGSSSGMASELSMCHHQLAAIHLRRGENDPAEYHLRQALETSSQVLGIDLSLASLLSQSDDPEKLKEAELLLDELSRDSGQMAFVSAKLGHCVVRARICLRTERYREASEFATVALGLDGSAGIDHAKRDPMDKPLLDESLRVEMKTIKEEADRRLDALAE